MSRGLCTALGALALPACASVGDPCLCFGVRGNFTADHVNAATAGGRRARGGHDDPGEHVLLSGSEIDLRGRTLAAEVTLGVQALQFVAGVEWEHAHDDDFRSRYYGLRFAFDAEKGAAGPYVDVLGRRLDDRDLQRTLFDGLEIGAGTLVALGGGWRIELRTCWSYTNGDAIRAGAESIAELRFGFGLRYEL